MQIIQSKLLFQLQTLQNQHIELDMIKSFEKEIINIIKNEKPENIESIKKSGKLDEETEKDFENFAQIFEKIEKLESFTERPLVTCYFRHVVKVLPQLHGSL